MFFVVKGEVEQIAMMKPKALTEHDEGMLEFLEDIIGSSRFKEPIDILSKRVEELNERRAEKVDGCNVFKFFSITQSEFKDVLLIREI